MNPILETIKNRRSTRLFNSQTVERQSLEQIIEAGLYAPSAHNRQSWHFTVIEDGQLLSDLNRSAKEVGKSIPDPMIQNMSNNEKFNIFYNAPTVVIVSGDEKGMMPEVDCAAATQNMLIAAESLGVASCWVGLVGFALNGPEKESYISRLSLPEGYKPYYAVSLGHADKQGAAAPKRRENTVTYL